jgi:plastocyanin
MKNAGYSFTVATLLLCAMALTVAGKVRPPELRSDNAANAGAAVAVAVAIKDFRFVPETITVKAGATVTWTNQDDEPHKIAADDGKFASPTLDTNEEYGHAFTTPGTYAYYCTLHPRMRGTIVVE